jgi:hypothetical protein
MAQDISSITNGLSYTAMKLLSVLRSEMALLGFTARNFENEVAQHGQTITINDLQISGTARTRAIGGAVTIDEANSLPKSVTLTQVYKGVGVDNLQRTFGSDTLMDDLATRLAIILADGADAQLVALHAKMPYECGPVDGSAAFNPTDKFSVLSKARQILTNNKVLTRGMKAVIGTTEAYNLRNLDGYTQASQAGSAEQLREGSLGRFMGFDLRESQNTPSTVTPSTSTQWGTPLIDNSSGYAIGTTTIHIDGAQASQTAPIKAGSTFSLGGIRYAVVADSTDTDGSGDCDLQIWPPLQAAVVNDDPLTPTSHSAAGSIGFAYNPDAFLWVVRPLAEFTPGSGVLSVVRTDPMSGLSVRLSIQSKLAGDAGVAMKEEVVADFLCGAGLIQPKGAVKIYGQV